MVTMTATATDTHQQTLISSAKTLKMSSATATSTTTTTMKKPRAPLVPPPARAAGHDDEKLKQLVTQTKEEEETYTTASTSTNLWTWTQSNSTLLFLLGVAQVTSHVVICGYLAEMNTFARHLIGHVVAILTCNLLCWGVDKIVYDSSKGRFKPTWGEYLKVYSVVLPHILLDAAVEHFFLLQYMDPLDNPSIFNTGWKVLLSLPPLAILVDFFFYSTHRLIHENKFLYRTVHKKHHEYTESFAQVFYYTTVAEHVMTVTFYQVIAALVVNGLIFTPYSVYEQTILMQYYQWVGYYGHTGTVVLSLDFANQINQRLGLHSSTRMHDMHHKYFLCNYGAFSAAWDHLFKTYRRWEDVKHD